MAAIPKTRDYLGVGWAFPVRPINGGLTYAMYEDDVEQAIGIILETAKRERVMRPTFGAGLRDFVFDPNSDVTHRAVESEVRDALTTWEPRITTQSVRAYADPDRSNVMMIEVDYVVRRTNSSFNLVYPFYLTEGLEMPIVSPQLDDLTFTTLADQLRRQIPIYTPEWTDHNDSDPGITFVQLFALLAEQIGYRLNKLPDKNFVEMLKLVGVQLQPAEPAQTLLAFYLTKPETATAFLIDEATRVQAKAGSPPPTFETVVPVDAVPAQLAALVTTSSDDLRDISGGVAMQPTESQTTYVQTHYDLQWDGRQPKLKDWPETPVVAWARPNDATHANLWLGLAFNPLPSAGFLGQRVVLTVQLDDDEQPTGDALADCNLDGVDVNTIADALAPTVELVYYRPAQPTESTGSWLDLRVISDGTLGFTQSGQIKLDIPLTMGPIPDSEWVDVRATPTLTTVALCAAAGGTSTPVLGGIAHPLVGALKTPVSGTPSKVPVSGWIGLRFATAPNAPIGLRAITFNAASAIAATTVTNELVGTGTGRSDQTAQLVNTNVLVDSLVLIVQDLSDDEYDTWTRVDNFDTATADDLVFVLDAEAGLIYFGDGVHGRVPGLTARIVATTYRWVSGGAASELPVASVTSGQNLPTFVSDVTNVVPARGGRDAETLDDAKLRAPQALKTLGRAVTAGDFAFLANQTPGVQIAKTIVIPLRRPYHAEGMQRSGVDMTRIAPGVVTLVCVPAGTGAFLAPTNGELTTVCQYINQFRLVTTEVYIAAPQYVRIFGLTITVVPKAGYTRTQLSGLIAAQLETFLHVLTGGADGTGFPFGSTLPQSELLAQVFRVEGVDRVESLTAQYDGTAPDATPPMTWRAERATPRNLVSCPTGALDDSSIVLAADETVFLDPTTFNVIVQTS